MSSRFLENIEANAPESDENFEKIFSVIDCN